MNEAMSNLKELQTIDDQLKYWRATVSQGPAKLTEARNHLRALETNLQNLNLKIEQMADHREKFEKEAAGLQIKKDESQKRQMMVKSNDEYAALLKEDEHFTRRISTLEDEILELLDGLDKGEVDKSDLEMLMTDEAAVYGQKATEIEKAVVEGRASLDIFQKRREELTAALSANDLSLYEKLFSDKGGKAVSAADGSLCLTCGLSFPPQIYNDLQRNEKINFCPNCGRIIFWRDHPDFKSVEA